LSEVINWLTRDTDKYVIFGASMDDDDLNTWDGTQTLEEFLDVVADGWDTHFDKDNMPVNGGHYAYFQEQVNKTNNGNRANGSYGHPGQIQHMFIQEWDAEDSEAFLTQFKEIISEHWNKNWVCGYGHYTIEAMYEIIWRRCNV